MVELYADAAPGRTDGDVGIQAPMLDPKVVEVPKRLPGEETQLGMVALSLKLGNDDDWEHDPVLSEPANRCRVREQNTGIQHVGATTPPGPGDTCAPRRPGWMHRAGGAFGRWLRRQRMRSRCGPAC